MAKGDGIEKRLVDFAVKIINLCDHLPKTRAGNYAAEQLLRSGTTPAAVYVEARGEESTRDFIHKLKICVKELNESGVWLKIITKSAMMPEAKLQIINQECDELCRMVNASIRTANK